MKNQSICFRKSNLRCYYETEYVYLSCFFNHVRTKKLNCIVWNDEKCQNFIRTHTLVCGDADWWDCLFPAFTCIQTSGLALLCMCARNPLRVYGVWVRVGVSVRLRSVHLVCLKITCLRLCLTDSNSWQAAVYQTAIERVVTAIRWKWIWNLRTNRCLCAFH